MGNMRRTRTRSDEDKNERTRSDEDENERTRVRGRG